jgi:hypothetical protein
MRIPKQYHKMISKEPDGSLMMDEGEDGYCVYLAEGYSIDGCEHIIQEDTPKGVIDSLKYRVGKDEETTE